MLAKKTIEEIDRLVREGKLTHRKIAVRVGVGRSTVDAIARGCRLLFGRSADADTDDSEELEPPVRCKQCGFMVHPPCLVCRTREYRDQQKRRKKSAAEVPSIATRRRRPNPRRERGGLRRPRVA